MTAATRQRQTGKRNKGWAAFACPSLFLHHGKRCGTLPSLTLVKVKSGYKSSNYADCSHFLFENDLCYFFTSIVLVLFIMLLMADFEINS